MKLIKHQVIPLWKSVKQSKLICSFKDDFIIPIHNASRFFLICLLDGLLDNIDQSNKRSTWFCICYPIYELGCCVLTNMLQYF